MAGIFDHVAISRVQQANDIVDVVAEHVSLKRKGREMLGLCPFHEDHTPSMNVSPTKQIFKCFACGAGGDVIKFVQMRENLTFPQAVERLAERAGIQLESRRSAAPQRRDPVSDVDPNLLARVNAWATKFFQQCLNDPERGKVARDYLASRKISAESIARWNLGVAPNAVDALAKAAGPRIPLRLLQQGGLVAGAGQDKFVHRLMFPITDATGRFIGFGGRTLSDAGAKYINSPTTPLFDKSNTLYGLEQARHRIVSTGTAVVVEGYTDVIMAHQFGCANVVATLGTSFTTGHGRTLRRYAKRVVLVYDSDVAGMEAANRALEVCLSQRLDIKLGFVPEGKDPCEFLLVAGKEAFDRVVDGATDVLQFKWDRLRMAFEGDDSLANRRTILNEFLQAVATGLAANNIPVLDSGLIVNKLSKIIGLTPREINADLSRRMGRVSKTMKSDGDRRNEVEPIDWGQGLYAAAQREVLEVLLNEPALFQGRQEEICVSLFNVPILRQIAEVLLDALRSDDGFSLSGLLARIESVSLAEGLVALQAAGEQKGNYASRLADAVSVLRRYRKDSQTIGLDQEGNEVRGVAAADGSGAGQNPHSLGLL
ncbi:MAG: DNA primase [Sedimentisphaerales bacterium]|jgi:DNA primase|nr:DNA primase [Sedimentisphaerales bacterium]HNY80729.1 DNA primase [Sedimentisphaerales bacterium]HOC65631.1 DNA primase [Sedimentisphaerales bacterium]HOH66533.1 DNA primase [Sedimentisphaerales bacterium]HPY50303.1 DNA primase [Sedimentisphaerales bacterium]